MNEDRRRKHLNQLLRDLSDTLDVPPSKYEEAKDHYKAVGDWLGEDNSELAPLDPQIYVQGSFALGTAVRPVGEDEYDVDAVCLLELTTDKTTQSALKEMIGRRLAHPSSRYKNMIDPSQGGRRCWTIQYSEGSKFHLDILPAIPDNPLWLKTIGVPKSLAEHAIRITDNKTPEYLTGWPTENTGTHDPTRSNPKGYAAWFTDCMRVQLDEAKSALAMEKRASVEDIQDYEVRTPLQRVIQILKRHRDVRLDGHDDKPISIIITTLAAQAYDNEAELYEAILKIVPGMRQHIENRSGEWWVANPVNPLENFADKWKENPSKAEMFFQWLDAVDVEYKHILTDQGFEKVGTYLAESFGQRDAAAAVKKATERAGPGTDVSLVGAKASSPARFDVPHREKPEKKWGLSLAYQVSLSGRYKHNGQWHPFQSNSRPLPKGCDLLFSADTNVPGKFEVYWQVVNTGAEAERADPDGKGLRGQIFPSKTAGKGGLTQKEATAYTGMHWVECLLVKGGVCVARSGEYVVNIQ